MPKSLSQCVTEFMVSEEFARLSVASQKRQKIVLDLLVKGERQRRLPDVKYTTAVMKLSDPITQLDRGAIDAALYRVRGHASVSTLNAYRTDMRRFGKWLLDSNILKQDPTSHLRNVKTQTSALKQKPVANEKVDEILEAAKEIHPRDGMTAMIFLYTGLRAAEVCKLRWRDLNLEHGTFVVDRGKNKDNHKSFIAPPLVEALKSWAVWVESKMNQEIDENWFVVPARAHRGDLTGQHRMNPDWPIVPWRQQIDAGKRVKSWLAAIGETNLKGRAAHTLRRTAANLVLDLPGADIRTAQRFLGHKSVAMTEIYLDKDVMAQQLQDVLQGFSITPKE